MGAWGSGIFDNDLAADFVSDLAEAPAGAPATLRACLEDATSGGGVDADVGAEALAAAAIVAAGIGGTPVPVDEEVAKVAPYAPADLAPLAVQAIDAVLGADSELVQLWEEAGELEAFKREPLAVREHLA